MTFEQWAAKSWLKPKHRTLVRYWRETNMTPLTRAQRAMIEKRRARQGHAAREAADRLHAFGTELCRCGHRRNAHEVKSIDGVHSVIDGACQIGKCDCRMFTR